ncbi:hypothetical protein BMS3Abin02_00855 [bacterium BMS3Abin02]|nr:hypothetical protein BMS3Abin02_00855 [bacterium BMS3Abin02]
MPEDRRRQPVDVLLEFPDEAGLANACDSNDGNKAGATFPLGGVQQVFEYPEFVVAADERRLDPVPSPGSAPHPRDASRTPHGDRFCLSFQHLRAKHLEVDGATRRADRRLSGQHRPRIGERL